MKHFIYHFTCIYVYTIPVVVGALGTIKKGMVQNSNKVSERATLTETQIIIIIITIIIIRLNKKKNHFE